MMKITLFALFAGLLMLGGFGYGSAEDKPDLSNTASPKDPIKSAVESAKLEDRNGYKYLPNTEKPYSGWAKETYDNGQVKSLTQFKEGNVVLATSWHENGQKKSKQNIQGAKEDGLWTSWKQDGLWTEWHENGQKTVEANVKDGKLDGLTTHWYEDGQKRYEGNYTSGKEEGLWTWWHENGGKQREGNYTSDKKDGLWTEWHENGQKMSEGNYTSGKEDGLWTWWHDGQAVFEANYKDGKGVFDWGVRERREEIRRLADIKAEEERKQEAPREELRVRDTNAAYAKLGDRFTISDLGFEMIWVKPGTFMMGSPVSEADRDKDEIQRQVTLTKGFYLGKYEVTQAQWERVMGNNPSHFKGSDRPVENVSWNDAVDFCKKLTEMEKKAGRVTQGMSYQLPTEAQWEYACRAGTSTMYSWGDSISSSNANYDENVDETTPVGKYPANPWGFHDIHGNLCEWCADWYGKYPTSSVTDPIGVTSGSYRVLRGGSWLVTGASLRSASRSYSDPSYCFGIIGLRVGFKQQ